VHISYDIARHPFLYPDIDQTVLFRNGVGTPKYDLPNIATREFTAVSEMVTKLFDKLLRYRI
jgi:hypothetical protein